MWYVVDICDVLVCCVWLYCVVVYVGVKGLMVCLVDVLVCIGDCMVVVILVDDLFSFLDVIECVVVVWVVVSVVVYDGNMGYVVELFGWLGLYLDMMVSLVVMIVFVVNGDLVMVCVIL